MGTCTYSKGGMPIPHRKKFDKNGGRETINVPFSTKDGLDGELDYMDRKYSRNYFKTRKPSDPWSM